METKVDNDQWQCGKSLPECLGFMFENEIACDVTFIVGEKKVEVKAHKTILISRSPVFYAMLNGPLKETDVITVPDIEDDIFKQLMRYMYTDVISLTEETVLTVLYAAKKYCLDGLSRQCSDFLSSSMTEENVFMLYEQAHVYDDQNLESSCLEKVKGNPQKCLESQSFLELSHKCCEKIVSSNDLCVAEEIIYERVIKWSEAECLRQQLEVSDVNKRKVLGSILYKIRFPVIDKDYFARHLLNSNLLNSDEKVVVMNYYFNISEGQSDIFESKKRITACEKTIRFRGFLYDTWSYTRGIADRISFTTSKAVLLKGVLLYGDDKMSEYTVDLSIFDDTNTVLSSIKTKYTATGQDWMSEIYLDTPVRIDANKACEVVALISGPSSIAGGQGLESVTINGNTISFFKILGLNNGTDVLNGQIPGLLLSN